MKKNLPIIVIAIVVIVLVVLSFIFLVKPNNETKTSTNTPTLNSGSVQKSEPEIINYAYVKGINTNEIDQGIDLGSFSKEDKTIDGIKYKNVNSISIVDDGSYNYKEYNNEDLSNYKNDEEEDYLFKDDVPIIPSCLVLMDDSINAFYNYNNEVYYIPVVKCSFEDEERIVYGDNLFSIYKNNGRICYNNNVLKIKYNNTEAESESEFSNYDILFDSYYLVQPDAKFSQANIYKTRLNNNTAYMIQTYPNNDSNITGICKTFIITNDDGSLDLCVAPRSLGTNIGNYSNVFFNYSDYIELGQSGEVLSSNDSNGYYIFDNGFKVVKGD